MTTSALLGIAWGVLGAAVGTGIRGFSRAIELQEPELDRRVTALDRWLPIALTAGLFAAFAVRLVSLPIPLRERYGLLAIYSIYLALLVQIFIFDLKHRIILDWVVGAGAALAFALAFVTPHFGDLPWLNALVGGVVAGALFGIIYLIGRGRALGAGDPKLAAFIGLVCGMSLQSSWRALSALFAGILLGGLVGAGVLLSRRRKLGDYIPYGPWLVLGAWLVLFMDPLLTRP